MEATCSEPGIACNAGGYCHDFAAVASVETGSCTSCAGSRAADCAEATCVAGFAAYSGGVCRPCHDFADVDSVVTGSGSSCTGLRADHCTGLQPADCVSATCAAGFTGYSSGTCSACHDFASVASVETGSCTSCTGIGVRRVYGSTVLRHATDIRYVHGSVVRHGAAHGRRAHGSAVRHGAAGVQHVHGSANRVTAAHLRCVHGSADLRHTAGFTQNDNRPGDSGEFILSLLPALCRQNSVAITRSLFCVTSEFSLFTASIYSGHGRHDQCYVLHPQRRWSPANAQAPPVLASINIVF